MTTNKYYKALKYFFIPLAIFLVFYFLLSVLLESFGIDLSILIKILHNHLGISNVFRLKDMFWPVALKIVFLLLLLVLIISSEVGFIKKETYGRTYLIIFLCLVLISFIFDFAYLIRNFKIFAVLSNIHLKYIEDFFINRVGIIPFFASLITYVLTALLIALYLFMMFDTVVYLNKRKHLFGEKDNSSWTCSECGSVNEGEFCKHCGIHKEYSKRRSEMPKEKEDIQLTLPESNKTHLDNEINLGLAEKKEKLSEEINLSLDHIEKASNQDIEMHVDINPFAKSIDKNISLEINPTEVKEVIHEYCPRCGEICDELVYCPHCGKKLK